MERTASEEADVQAMQDELLNPAAEATRNPLRVCPACGGNPDGYRYEPDEEQVVWGYPAEFRICESCECPLVEIGAGHCREFVK